MRNMLRIVLGFIGLHLCLANSAQAMAVGDITVYSRQGEPFAAEIRLRLEARERAKGVEVTLGPQEAYQSEGIKRPALIDGLSATVTGRHDTIRLASQVPIQETSFPLLLSVRVGQVTIVKHYHVALQAPAPAMSYPLAPLATIAPLTPASRPSKALTRQARRSQTRPERYGPVERGATLYSVAKSLPVPPEKVWQTVVALWRANKEQFAAGNVHGLNVGTYLDIPPDLSESIAAMRLAEAQEIVASQWEEWQALQRLGAGKHRVIAAATRDPDAAIAAYGRRESTGKRETTPQPTDKPLEKPAAHAVVLPVSKAGSMVSMTELQNVLQGLEERLMRRMTPTTRQEFKDTTSSTTAFVSASELQASIQHLEERLTQRMQQMFLQTQMPEPILVGQRPTQHTRQLTPTPTSGDNGQHTAMTLMPYLLVLTNALLLLLMGGVLWLWLRRRDRAARMQRV